jgi:hypothetical protein
MSDYPLMNRLATEGEVWTTHRFPSGSIGLASPEDVRNSRMSEPNVPAGFWGKLRSWLIGSVRCPLVSAVYIRPGARLRLYGVPEGTRRILGVSPREEVTFTQIRVSENQFRDAVRFAIGRDILLQELGEGVGVQVLNLSPVDSHEPVSRGQSVHR